MLDKKNYEFENGKSVFDVKLCTNNDIITKMYKLLLKLGTG